MPASPCLAAIVLLIDMSASVSHGMYAAQRDGAAAAFEDPQLIRTIEASDGVAVLMADFDNVSVTRLPWTVVRDAASARRLAGAMRAVERSSGVGSTAIGRAIAHAQDALSAPPCAPGLRLIDISTDGMENNARPPAREARDAAAAEGIVINAIAFLDPNVATVAELPGEEMLAEAEAWLRAHVATGFVRVARQQDGFRNAFRSKVVFELTQQAAPPR
jgi:hypothetical protein